MRWPEWTDKFGRCFGCRQGPHHQHYDAWLARERLNQLNRLEVKLADLTRENGELSARLGQAVGILDSYHSFDLDQMGLAALSAGSGGLGPQPPEAVRQGISARRLAGSAGSIGNDRGAGLAGRIDSMGGPRGGVTAMPHSGSGRMALMRASAGGGALAGRAPTPPQGRVGSLQVQPNMRSSTTPPPRIQQMLADRAVASTRAPAAPRPSARALDIPNSRELDELLRRAEAQRAPPSHRARTSPNTVVSIPPFVPAPLTRGRSDDVTSVASEPQEPKEPLPSKGEGVDEAVPSLEMVRSSSYAGDRLGNIHDKTSRRNISLAMPVVPVVPIGSPVLPMERSGGMGRRTDSFSFGPPAGMTGEMDETPRQLPIPSAFANGAEAPAPVLPAVMTSHNTQPVRDAPRLATQARGQIYTSHYSPETSPFAQAAQRMPTAQGRLPLSRHMPQR